MLPVAGVSGKANCCYTSTWTQVLVFNIMGPMVSRLYYTDLTCKDKDTGLESYYSQATLIKVTELQVTLIPSVPVASWCRPYIMDII